MKSKIPDTVNEPDWEHTHHSYADYLTWQKEEVVELIRGRFLKKRPLLRERFSKKFREHFFSGWVIF